jgi:hypothetical protein
MYWAPGIGSGRGFESVAITMYLAFNRRSLTRMVFGPANAACPLITSTCRRSIALARLSGMSLIISFSRSIRAAQSSFGFPTEIL